tara:strand:+ start:453 stop:662 length:210 start_codon:yes stop_codon:yes gene_type:complete
MKKKHWLAEEIKAIRLSKQLPMQHVAMAAFIHVNTLQRYESGVSTMSIEAIERVLAVLGYEMEVFPVEK